MPGQSRVKHETYRHDGVGYAAGREMLRRYRLNETVAELAREKWMCRDGKTIRKFDNKSVSLAIKRARQMESEKDFEMEMLGVST